MTFTKGEIQQPEFNAGGAVRGVLGNSVRFVICSWCAASILEDPRGDHVAKHIAWHKALSKIAVQARQAEARGRLLG